MDDRARHADERQVFEEMILGLIWTELQTAGLPAAGGSLAEIARAIGVSGFLERWLEATLAFLDRDGLVERQGEAWIARTPARPVPTWSDWAAHRPVWRADPAVAPLVDVAEAALRALPDILAGRRRATDVLFPGGSLDLVEGVYKNNPIADRFNTVVADTVAALLEARVAIDPAARLRLIEFGAGTGGTSTGVLARLLDFPDRVEEYGYSDLSRAFLNHAEATFGAAHPYLKTRIVNVEKPVTAQGVPAGGYDIAIAANVLHATRDIRRTLRNVKAALRPNGVLILNELADNTVFAHATFGLLEGWWLYEDAALRIPGSPILTPESWRIALEAEGFRAVICPAAADRALGQQVIVAESDGLVRLPADVAADRDGTRPAEAPRPAARAGSVRATAVRIAMSDVEASDREPVRPVTARSMPARPILAPPPRRRVPVEAAAAQTQRGATAGSRPSTAAPRADVDLRPGLVEHLRERFGTVLGIGRSEIDVKAPVESYGVDSILTVQLASDLGRTFRNVGATLFFEHNTIVSLADHLCRSEPDTVRSLVGVPEEIGFDPEPAAFEALPAEAAPLPRPALDPVPAARFGRRPPREARPALDVAIVGLAGRYPGGDTVDAFWSLLRQGQSAIREIPPERWDWRRHFDAERGREGRSYARFGGFIDGVDRFDPLFFRISPREAERMDPQERLFLEIAHACLEDAGYRPRDLDADRAVGVFVGAMNAYYPTGARAWSIANRVSYVFDFTGPSLAVDTACSSSLTAIHLAVEALRAGGIAAALAGGVNLIVDPRHYVGLSEATMLSSGDKVRAFGAEADGFVDGEGVGAVLLKPLDRAMADGDRIYGVIRGTALNHGGKTNGYTVPNPQAQARVIEKALGASGVDARDLSYVEAHGTGTALGDPIEIAGLARAFEIFTPDRGFCAIGSAKSNIGHCESAAGIAGLTKVLLQMRHGELAPSLHAENLNPHIDFDATPFVVQRERAPWRRPVGPDGREKPRIAGISSFGAGGANAHVVIEEFVAAQAARREPTVGPQVLVLSARTEDQLRRRAADLVAALGGDDLDGVDLADIAFTLQLGREALDHRLALVADSVAAFRRQLEDWLDGGQASGRLWIGTARRETDGVLALVDEDDLAGIVERWLERGDLTRLAEAWTRGIAIDWPRLHDGPRRRVRLPTYPFERERYWIEATPTATPNATPGLSHQPVVLTGPTPDAPPTRAAAAEAIRIPQAAPSRVAPDPVVSPAAAMSAVFRTAAAAVLKLRPEQIADDAELVAYGFDSITFAQLANRLNEAHDLGLAASDFFEDRTLGAVIARLRRVRAPAVAAAFPAPAEIAVEPFTGTETQVPNPDAQAGSAPAGRTAPLSAAQRRLWLVEQMEDLGAAYHVPVVLRLRGTIDAQALRCAVAALAARHEALRTRIVPAGAEAVQVIDPPGEPSFRVEQAPGDAPDAREAAAERRKREIVAEPFDLAAGPLMRATLIRLDAAEALFVLVIHHIVTDGWSMDLIGAELPELYRAALEDRPAGLEPPTSTFADAIRADAAPDPAHLDHWRTELAGAPPESTFPTEFPRPAKRSHRGEAIRFVWPAPLVIGLRRLARETGATLFMVLAAGVQTLIARLSGQDDVVIGTAIAGRDSRDREHVVGFFADTLPLRVDLAGDPSFAALVRRVRAAAERAYAHQGIGFERLIEALNPDRDLARHPLFQVMLTLRRQGSAGAVPFGPEATAEPVDPGIRATPFDAMLHLLEGPDAITGTLEYALDLYGRDAVLRLAENLQTLLEAAVAAPETAIGDLALMSVDARDRMLAALAGPARPLDGLAPVHRQIGDQAARTPDAPAILFAGERFSYAELDRRSDRLAAVLRASGVGRGAIVGVCLERSFDAVAALLAVWKAGGAYLPLDPSYPAARLGMMFADSSAGVLVTRSGLADVVPAGSAAVVFVDDLAEAIPAERPDEAPVANDPARDLAYVLYTSGSTGRPKGVMIPHRALSNFLAAMADRVPLSSGDVLAAVTPLSFDIAGLELWLPLVSGATVAIADRPTATSGTALAAFLDAVGASVLQATPATWRMLIEAGWRARPGLTALCGGEALTPDLAQALTADGATAWNLYGPTETTIWSTALKLSPEWRGGSIGRPIDNTQLYVLDRRGRLLPPWAPGELAITGAGLGLGYLGRDDLTAERFPPDPFGPPGARLYRTGDLVRARPDGEIEYLGRLDHQVKIRGHRIELGEIEAALRDDAAVRETVVVARDVGPGDRRLAAYVVADIASAEAPAADDADRIEAWRDVWDGTYREAGDDAAPGFAGWTTRFTGEAIPEAEMRVWLDETCARIEALRPKHLLELGCGLGLLLDRLAPKVDVYCGADVSPTAIARLARWIRRRPGLGHVRLARREAADYWDAEEGAFDLVVLNSVVQYFPDADHLETVLARAVAMAPGGGAIFVGDIRPRSLLPVQIRAAEVSRAPADDRVRDVRERARRAEAAEAELTLDPGFFFALAERHQRLSGVEIRLKAAGTDNELTRYRYDVVLRVEGDRTTAPDGVVDWTGDVALAAIAARLAAARPPALVLRGIGNARLTRDLAWAAALDGADGDIAVEAIRIAVDETGGSLDPVAASALAERHGYRFVAAWAADAPAGTIDGAFYDPERVDPASLALGRPTVLREAAAYAADPRRPEGDGGLAGRLATRLRESLPEHMVPPDIVVLPKLPLTPNGKIDRAALPSPDTARQGRARGPDSRRAPTGPTETALAAIWSKVLGVADVGADDDFFALGGHSLLVMRVVIGVREALGVELVMRDLFEAPTVAALAERLASRSGRPETPSSPTSGQARSVLLRPGTGAPLVLFHAIGGGLGVYGPLVDALGISGPVHGLNGLRDDAPADVEALGRDWADEIERLAPEGDARLIGWSFGGVVAYEAARQLIDRGRPPRAVALIDACLPIRGPGERFSSDEVWAAFAHVLAADVIGAETPEAVAPPVGDFAALVQRHPRLRAADLVALYGTFARNMQAWAAYRPQAMSAPVPMTLIRAADGPDPAAMGRLFPDWAALAGAGSTVTLPGDHVSLLRPPHVAAVAAAIEARADDLRRAG